jgi:hypothetical protein
MKMNIPLQIKGWQHCTGRVDHCASNVRFGSLAIESDVRVRCFHPHIRHVPVLTDVC